MLREPKASPTVLAASMLRRAALLATSTVGLALDFASTHVLGERAVQSLLQLLLLQMQAS